MRAPLAMLLCLSLVLQIGLPVATAHAQSPAAKRSLPQLTVKLEDLTYPASARKAGMQGRVLVAFAITKRGHADEPEVVSAEPVGEFDEAAIKAIKKVRFTVPDDWVDTQGPSHRFQLSILFKLSPCVAPGCSAPTPHESADDFLIIGAEAER